MRKALIFIIMKF